MTNGYGSRGGSLSDASGSEAPAAQFGHESEAVSTRRPRSKAVAHRCPHCRAHSTVRTSREVTLTLREVTYQCSNAECGHTYVVNMEFARTLSPSATPNLALKLPMSKHVRERLAKQLELSL